jgi:osmotically-inducible protein OsmY
MNRSENREIQMKPFQKISISVFLMFQLAAFTACKTHPHKHKVAELLDDKVTTERVELALRRNGADEFNHVKVSTSEGVVTLTGFVSNSDAKRRAEKVAEETHRATHVQNEIQIK